ncbi:hypothetical protein FRC06_008206 [Ceratobasidium sp. 370]|nr:hypothetical protein FRC06_008206 [Ceratobasidium sp. 370]
MPKTTSQATPHTSDDNTPPREAQSIVYSHQVPQKHPRLYFNDSLVTIQVENTLFNVYKSQLLKSETFRDMFSLGDAAPTNDDPDLKQKVIAGEGSESNPIKLSGIRSNDFEKLLTVLYTL